MLRRTMRCSFCRRPHIDVAKLVAGPSRLSVGQVYICDRCTVQSMKIMESHSGHSADAPLRANSRSLVRRMLGRLGWTGPRAGEGSECHAV